MQITGGQKDVNPGAVCGLQGPRRHLDVFLAGACQRGDARFANGLRDGRDGREVTFRGHGKASLDHIDTQIFEGMRHRQLFLGGHAATGRLLAVAQGGIKENYVIGNRTHTFRLLVQHW